MSKNVAREGQDWHGILSAIKDSFPSTDNNQPAAPSAPTAPAASVEEIPATEAQAPVVTATEEPKPTEAPMASPAPAQETVTGQTAPAAGSEAAPVQVKHTGPLPDLSSVPTLSNEDLESMEREKAQKAQWAQAAAEKILDLERALALLMDRAGKDPDFLLSDEYKEKRRLIEFGDPARGINGLAQIQDAGGSEELRKRLEFSRLIKEIRLATEAIERAKTSDYGSGLVRKIVGKILASGRRRMASLEEAAAFDKAKRWPAGTIFLGREAYLPRDLKDGEHYTKADGALEVTFRDMANALKSNRRHETEEKVSSMRERGSADGALRNQFGIFREAVGVYYLHSPKNPERHVFADGHLVLEVRNDNRDPKRRPFFVAHVLESMGSLGWMSKDSPTSLPLFWIQQKDPEARKTYRGCTGKAERMANVIRALIFANAPKDVRKQPVPTESSSEATQKTGAATEPAVDVKAPVADQPLTTTPEVPVVEPQGQPVTVESRKAASKPEPTKAKVRRRKN